MNKINVDIKLWKKYICKRNRRLAEKHGFNDTEREKYYVRMKKCQSNESFANGSVGAGVRMLV